KHIANIMECDDKTLSHLTMVIKSLAQTFLDQGFTGINLLNANGKTAGQSVEHLHFHLLLRQTNDGINAWPKLPGSTISLDETYANLKINDNNVH
ncbi:MAG TPA: HIT domain-containing protein, partial [Candidatus Ligilactobacillus excrementavium]|nr:HIT domain-containing protein [Candidatus Ligilactobacillus excrementavium]